jgi:hypothetical protein
MELAPRRGLSVRDTCTAFEIVCAWCQQHLRWHQVQPPPFAISYGICARCFAQVLMGMAAP